MIQMKTTINKKLYLQITTLLCLCNPIYAQTAIDSTLISKIANIEQTIVFWGGIDYDEDTSKLYKNKQLNEFAALSEKRIDLIWILRDFIGEGKKYRTSNGKRPAPKAHTSIIQTNGKVKRKNMTVDSFFEYLMNHRLSIKTAEVRSVTIYAFNKADLLSTGLFSNQHIAICRDKIHYVKTNGEFVNISQQNDVFGVETRNPDVYHAVLENKDGILIGDFEVDITLK